MNPRIGVPLIVALLLASSWAFSNEDITNIRKLSWVSGLNVDLQSGEAQF